MAASTPGICQDFRSLLGEEDLMLSSSRTRAWARVVTGLVVVALAFLWGALPVGAGDPLGQITEFTDGLTPNNGPNRITDGPDGNLWFTEAARGSPQTAKIGRITPSGVITEFSDGLTPNSGLVAITSGADGNLWFAEMNDP